MKLMKRKKGADKGFSLVELLIVVGIIAVLVAVLAAGLIKYIEKSKIRKDVSNAGVIVSTVEQALGEPEIHRELVGRMADGATVPLIFNVGSKYIAPGNYPLLEGTLVSNLGNGPEFAYKKYSPSVWHINLKRSGDVITATVSVTTSIGEIQLAPKAEAPYDK
ncbi:MAG: type II secretion system protein [Lachnospiraceae bacterium]|nr:type II secretion system protein [Lachnospiraceae bacterium]